MFTSRAEHRLLLREDNADLRLTEMGRKLGLIDDQRWRFFSEKRELIEQEQTRLRQTFVHPGTPAAKVLEPYLDKPLAREYSYAELLKRPQISYAVLAEIDGDAVQHEQVAQQVETQARYAGYIERQTEEIARVRRFEHLELPRDFAFSRVAGLSHEVCEKLMSARPTTLGQASRIPGVTPAAISLLLVHLKRGGSLDSGLLSRASSATEAAGDVSSNQRQAS
jgi:tRNA uridine 5-carboxymethylaminomethyl modification enzyme